MQTISFPTTRSSALPEEHSNHPLNEALVEFFARSRTASKVLRLLGAQNGPLGYKRLVDGLRFNTRWSPANDAVSAGAIRSVLSITQAARLVRLTREGFSITDTGREVLRRIDPGDRPVPHRSKKAHRLRKLTSNLERTHRNVSCH